jgi:hypothetical protein
MQYSLFTHGTALQIETPAELASNIKVGWGTQISFRQPVVEIGDEGLQISEREGPGSWFHITLPSTLTTFGRRNPRLESITLLFETRGNCRILRVHVYDGSDIVEEFNDFGIFKLGGEFLRARNSKDINPEAPRPNHESFGNTFQLTKSHRVFSVIGISFYACAFGRQPDPKFHSIEESVLVMSAAGGQFTVEDDIFARVVAVVERFVGRSREP